MHRAACLPALLLSLAAAPASAQDWRPVPGAAALQLDLASLELQGSRISGRVRYPATAPEADLLGPDGALRATRGARQVALAQVDCRTRTVRALGTVAYDGGGRVLASGSVPGPERAVPDRGDLALLHDALCELAREQRGR